MVKLAYIFPGQGSQYVGMGKDFYENFLPSREIFNKADEILGFKLSNLCFQGPLEELTRTRNCQPAVFVVSIACLKALHYQLPIFDSVYFTAGLSLGEYSALVASESLTFEEGLKLVGKRAQFMEEASIKNPGAMISILGLDINAVKDICSQTQTEIANLNCPGQVVISGSKENINKAKILAEERGAKKVLFLEVSGAFHSSLMEPAAIKLEEELKKIKISPPKIPVVSNVTARCEISPQVIFQNLSLQIKSTTHWEDSIRFMAKQTVKIFLEIGPGKVLRGLIKRIDPNLEVYNIEKIEDLEKLKSLPLVG